MSQRPPMLPPSKKAPAPIDQAAADRFVESAPDGKAGKEAKASPKRVPVTMKYPEDLLALIDEEARDTHMTRTTFMLQAAINELKRLGRLK